MPFLCTTNPKYMPTLGYRIFEYIPLYGLQHCNNSACCCTTASQHWKGIGPTMGWKLICVVYLPYFSLVNKTRVDGNRSTYTASCQAVGNRQGANWSIFFCK